MSVGIDWASTIGSSCDSEFEAAGETGISESCLDKDCDVGCDEDWDEDWDVDWDVDWDEDWDVDCVRLLEDALVEASDTVSVLFSVSASFFAEESELTLAVAIVEPGNI